MGLTTCDEQGPDTRYPKIEPLRPVSPDYKRGTSIFTGKIHWVQLGLGKDGHDHLISPEERLRLAMTKQ